MGPSRIAGRYELQEQLGEGGMGVVWRALDTKTGGPVAIKLMKDISDPVAVDLFTKEWRALAEMCHPNIVDVRDVDVIEENRQKKPFFVMPLLRGATLAELIANASARLTLDRVVEIMTQVCRGLQAAHHRGLVHRDLKPSNIFVMDDYTAKIIDFGVVHLAGSKSVTGQKGTFQYMSPEQAQLKEITPASDLFSLGVILYEALTLRKPFARPTADETIQAVVKYMPPPVSEINPSINQSVSRVVHKCLAKQPLHRFASARDLADALQKASRNEVVFDTAKIEPRIERAKTAFKSGDEGFASEILAELEAEGNLDPRITVLRMQIDMAVKQKKTRQLLESARARMEQDEIPLALDKLREALELDPQNPDALAMREAMEKQRHETQITKWFELAQTHLGNRDFSAARHAVQEVLAIRPGDSRALDLLDKVEATEADAKRIREQKEQLYASALRAYQNGEMDTALSRLERLFSVARANPSAAVPERDAVYQSFYKEVRSEQDAIHSALEDAQRQFGEKNFAGAMVVCRELLNKYPNDGTFQALKIRIEDAERQELSSYIADVSQRADAEPDLDRRANILREACERYPSEGQFAQRLKLVRERRDLVNSVVAKARQYEERGQYAEAISQWDILRNIHPQYPGIAFELEECKKKRDRQARDEEQARLVEEIDGLMESRAYAKAIECADAALLEFPGDAELSGLRTLAEQGMERAQESRRIFEEAQQALAATDSDRAVDLLRRCLSLDSRAPGVRDSLVSVLADQARVLAEFNWQKAEPLYQEASDLDPNHPAVRALRSTIVEAKRQTFVGQCLTECRSLVAAGKPQEAAEKIHAARGEYPNDPRLEQYEATLQKEVNEVRRKEERGRDRAALGENRRLLEGNPDRARMRAVLEGSYAIRARHPDDPEIGQTVAEIELTARRVAKIDDLSQLLRMETVRTGTDGRGAVAKASPSQPQTEERKGPRLVDKSAEKTRLFQPPKKESGAQPAIRRLEEFANAVVQHVLGFLRPAGRWSEARLGAIAGTLVLIAAVGYFVSWVYGRRNEPPPPQPQYVDVAVTPSDSTVTLNGAPITENRAVVGSTIEISHLGYKTKKIALQQESDGKVALEPESLHLSIQAASDTGSVELDGRKLGDLSQGSLSDQSLAADGTAHKLTVSGQGKQPFTVEFQVTAGFRPRVTSVEGNDVFVVSSLGNAASIYGGGQLKTIRLGNQPIEVSPSGTDFNINEQNSEIRWDGSDQGSRSLEVSNAPDLVIQSLTGAGVLAITTNAERATLTIDGKPVQGQRHAWSFRGLTGVHEFAITAEGYQPQSWRMTLQRGQSATRSVELPRIELPKMAALLITGGTPGAEVDLDGKRIGELDANGNLERRNILPSGKHTLAMAKPYHESRIFEITPASAEISIPNPVLPPWASLSFEPAPANATVRYRRAGESEFHTAPVAGRLQLPAGKYEVTAEAPEYEKLTSEFNVGRENVVVSLKLIPLPVFLDMNQIVKDGPWLKAKNPKEFVALRAGLLRATLIFSRPGKTLLWDKKVEWVVELPQRHVRVQFALAGDKLSRKLVDREHSSDQKDVKVDATSVGQASAVSVHVRVEGSRVTVSNDKGEILDDYSAQGYDFSSGRIAVRTDSEFLVRSE